jgi:DNA-binding NarL/FixJ family response regulator
MATNVFLVDDHELMREGLKTVLKNHHEIVVVGEAGSFSDMVAGLKSDEVDIIILDINLPDKGGLEVLRYLRQEHPDIRILVLSMHPEERFAVRVLRGGALGYVNKQSAARELIVAIERIMNGGRYLSPEMTDQLVSEYSGKKELLHQRLTDREFEILRMIALGHPAAQIANDLSLSVNTVNTYRARILEKMSLKSNADIIRYALEHSLID